MISFTFGQVEAVTAALNRIATDKRVAFMGRLKQLQKQKLTDPEGRPGRGRKGTYSFGDLMKFVLAVELIQAGLMPQMAARLVNGSWSGLQYSIFSATYSDEELEEWQEMPFGPEWVDWYWMLTPEALRDMSEEGMDRYDHMEAIMPVPADEVAERLQSDREIGVLGEGWRMIVLHGTKIVKRTIFLVEHQFRYAKAEDLRAELQDEFDRLRSMLDDSPFMGVEETARKAFESTLEAARHNMEDEARRARYHPSEAILDRQAAKMLGKLSPHLLAYIRNEEFAGTTTPDIKAMRDLMGQGVIIPNMASERLVLELSPLGHVLKRLSAEIELPRDAIGEWRRTEQAKIHEAVQRRIDQLLASDPDNPEDDEALERWARHGGKAPLSKARSQEIARRFIGGMRDELKDDPEGWEAFKDTLNRNSENGDGDGDDQEA